MGACCGGMGNSHQHKSLPDKNKPGAAKNTNNEHQHQQLSNDVASPVPPVADVKSSSGEDGQGQQPVQCSDAQFEAAICTLAESLESCPPPVAAAELETQPAADNHVQPGQQKELRIEEDSNVEVAANVNAVFAEPPLAASAAAEVASEPAAIGDEATGADDNGFEIIGEETVQLRISEDGDLEKQTAVPDLERAPQISHDEVLAPSNEQIPVVAIETADKPEIVEAVESHPVQRELELAEDVPSPVTVASHPEVSSAVPVADVTTEIVTESVAASGDGGYSEVATSVQVEQQTIVVDTIPEQKQAEPDVPVPSSHETVVEQQPEVAVPVPSAAELSSDVQLPTTEPVSAGGETQELPVSDIKDEQSVPVLPAGGDQPDGGQQEIPSPAGDHVTNVEPARIEEPETASAEVKSEQLEAVSTPAEEQQLVQSETQQHEPPVVDAVASEPVHGSSEQPATEPTVDSVEHQADVAEHAEENPAAATFAVEQDLPAVDAAQAPETVSEIPTQEPAATSSEESAPLDHFSPPAEFNSELATSAAVETPASATVDETSSVAPASEHAAAATVIAEADDLPPPEPELLSSPTSEAVAADNVDSFPLPPPPAEENGDLGHPTTLTAVDGDFQAAPVSESAVVNGEASISPSDESTASSSSVSGLNDESAAAALKSAAAADFVAVDGQHSAAVTAEA